MTRGRRWDRSSTTKHAVALLALSLCGAVTTSPLQLFLAEPPSLPVRVGMGDQARCPWCAAPRDAAAGRSCRIADTRRQVDLGCGAHVLRSKRHLERSAS